MATAQCGVVGSSTRCSGCTLSFPWMGICSARSDMVSGARTQSGKRPSTTTVVAVAGLADRAQLVPHPALGDMLPTCRVAMLAAPAPDPLRAAVVAGEGSRAGAAAAYRSVAPLAPSGMPPVAAATARSLQVLFKEVSFLFEELSAERSAHSVTLLRIHDHVEDAAGAFERIGHLHGVLKEHVVVFDVVQHEEFAFQFLGVLHG